MSIRRKGKNPQSGGKKIDIIVPVMGPTGAGKSTFINFALGREMTKAGHGTTSCTSDPLPIVLDNPFPGDPHFRRCRLVLLDTPGFDDTHHEDVEILRRIARWLEKSCREGNLVGGVLYFHDISAKRFTGTARQNLVMFSRLCGQDALEKTELVTTNWGSGRTEILEQRESEMKDEHWSPLIEKGVKVRRFLRDSESALDVLNHLLGHIDVDSLLDLQIQKELLEFRMSIPETQAGQELRYTLKQLLKMQNETVTLEKSLMQNGDSEARANLKDAEKKMQELQNQVQELRVKLSLPKKLMKMFGLLVGAFHRCYVIAVLKDSYSRRVENLPV
ncbi:unnamed protein product [Cyclocybe aegerita]|uniref:G domain-containing protein n=1 Tax=Cyclocybe aegerita TaxID=1973307 RepID=A0A8S0WHE8_CYCAE|nr:unnamed protein product [Cyclocybe aegerita]